MQASMLFLPVRRAGPVRRRGHRGPGPLHRDDFDRVVISLTRRRASTATDPSQASPSRPAADRQPVGARRRRRPVGTRASPTYHPVSTQLTSCSACHTSRSRQRRTAIAASGSSQQRGLGRGRRRHDECRGQQDQAGAGGRERRRTPGPPDQPPHGARRQGEDHDLDDGACRGGRAGARPGEEEPDRADVGGLRRSRGRERDDDVGRGGGEQRVDAVAGATAHGDHAHEGDGDRQRERRPHTGSDAGEPRAARGPAPQQHGHADGRHQLPLTASGRGARGRSPTRRPPRAGARRRGRAARWPAGEGGERRRRGRPWSRTAAGAGQPLGRALQPRGHPRGRRPGVDRRAARSVQHSSA